LFFTGILKELDKRITELEREIKKERQRSDYLIKRINEMEHERESKRLRVCPKCGAKLIEKSIGSVFMPVWEYACPEHGVVFK
jgi:transcription initiation factor IIE alpha subunit